MRRMSSDWRSARWQLNDLRSVDSVSINQTALFCSPPFSLLLLPSSAPVSPDFSVRSPPALRSSPLSILPPSDSRPNVADFAGAPYLSRVLLDGGSRVGGNLSFEGCFCSLRKKRTDRSSSDRSEARVVFSCASRTVCVRVCGESSALSLAICFPGGPTGVSPASRGRPDSSGIWRTGPAGPPGQSSSHGSASSSSASTFCSPWLLLSCVVLSVRICSEPVAPSSFCHFPSCSFSPFFLFRVSVSLPLIRSVIFHLAVRSRLCLISSKWTRLLAWLGRPILLPVLARKEGVSGRSISGRALASVCSHKDEGVN